MSVSKLPHLSHGVHTIDFLNEPVVLSVLLPCPSRIRVFSAISTTAIGGAGVAKCHGTRHSAGGNGFRRETGLGFDERGERKVRCEVDVISWRERRIRGEIWVDSDSQSVWNVLTDYERLADFIPNLVCRYFTQYYPLFFFQILIIICIILLNNLKRSNFCSLVVLRNGF